MRYHPAGTVPWRGQSLVFLQVGQHREDAAVVGLRGREAELLEDARDVLLDRADREHERVGDRRVRPALGHQLQHLELARREDVQTVSAAVTSGPSFSDKVCVISRRERSSAMVEPTRVGVTRDRSVVGEEAVDAFAGVVERGLCRGDLLVAAGFCHL